MSYDDFHEVWWIYSPERHEWGGLRIAHFRKTWDDTMLVFINGEADKRRTGLRVWDDIAPREGWVKVKQIMTPSPTEVQAAVDAKLREIASTIATEVGY